MDDKLIELIEKIGRIKLLVEEIPAMPHSNSCPADDDTGWPAPCKCNADLFNDAVEKIRHELGISYMQKLMKKRVKGGAA